MGSDEMVPMFFLGFAVILALPYLGRYAVPGPMSLKYTNAYLFLALGSVAYGRVSFELENVFAAFGRHHCMQLSQPSKFVGEN